MTRSYAIRIILLLWVFPVLAQVPDGGMIKKAKHDYQAGNYVPALRNAVKVYGEALVQKNDTLAADAANLVGLVYLAQGQAANAMAFFRKALAINDRAGKKKRSAANELNIALAFGDLKQLDSAVFYAQRCLTLSRSIGAANLVAMASNHLGDFEMKRSQWETARQYFESVIYNKAYQSDWENSFAAAGLARLHFHYREYQLAGLMADRAYRLALKNGAKWDAAQALDLAQQAYHRLGNDTAAFDRLRLFKLYTDSLTSIAKNHELDQLQFQEKALQYRLLQQQTKIDRLIIVILTLAAVLFAVMAIWVIQQNRRTTRHNLELKVLNSEKDRLFSIIGHDLKSPFSTLQSTLQLLSSGDLTAAEMNEISRQLAEQLQGATMMLDSLLTWAGKQLQGITAQAIPLDLTAKINKVLAVLLPVAAHKGVLITHELAILPKVSGDPDQVRIMIQNLVANAIKFTPSGNQVELSYENHPQGVLLMIKDQGIGMSPDLLQAILNTRTPTRSSYGTANEKGIGLGMLLVRDFAEQNGIKLTAESKPGAGTVFRLLFRLAE